MKEYHWIIQMLKAVKLLIIVLTTLSAYAAKAAEIIVSWETNGVLVAEGMKPGSPVVVEAVSNLGETFSNAATFFDTTYMADSNGTIRLEIPMFFRVKVPPEGMVEIPGGINSGKNPLAHGESYNFEYPETYSLTNEATFNMDATEVTKAQWDEVYNWATNNSYGFSNPGAGKASDHPVQSVNWYDCVKWCNARSEKEGKTPCYTVSGNIYKTGEITPDCDIGAGGYRLPTSGEWEYAARGGLSGKRFPWGDTITHSDANYFSTTSYSYDISPTREYHPNYSDGGYPYTSPAGWSFAFVANGYGLYDMSGNVYEWCNDWAPNYVGLGRVIRGGGWYNHASAVRCGREFRRGPDVAATDVGFRSVLPAN